MKSNVASVWLVGLVITFLLIFSSYIIITADYSKSIKLKNEVLSIIEKNKGATVTTPISDTSSISGESMVYNVGSLKTINAFLAASTYTAKGPCGVSFTGEKWIGVYKLVYDSNESFYEEASGNKTYYYCVAKYNTGRFGREYYPSVYYKVQLFYKFEIPVLRELLPVRIEGITDEVYLPSSSDVFTTSTTNGDYY